jgi:hypothetical protein
MSQTPDKFQCCPYTPPRKGSYVLDKSGLRAQPYNLGE